MVLVLRHLLLLGVTVALVLETVYEQGQRNFTALVVEAVREHQGLDLVDLGLAVKVHQAQETVFVALAVVVVVEVQAVAEGTE